VSHGSGKGAACESRLVRGAALLSLFGGSATPVAFWWKCDATGDARVNRFSTSHNHQLARGTRKAAGDLVEFRPAVRAEVASPLASRRAWQGSRARARRPVVQRELAQPQVFSAQLSHRLNERLRGVVHQEEPCKRQRLGEGTPRLRQQARAKAVRLLLSLAHQLHGNRLRMHLLVDPYRPGRVERTASATFSFRDRVY
jgi:hypothetical protein